MVVVVGGVVLAASISTPLAITSALAPLTGVRQEASVVAVLLFVCLFVCLL